jgi:hypothetical protein
MRRFTFFITAKLWLLLLLGSFCASAQLKRVQGRVYDISEKMPLPLVSVITSSGRGAITDSTGFYSIEVTDKDSIWFSYLGKSTPPYLVSQIAYPAGFDISIRMKIVDLPLVTVRQRNYREDSLQNRKDYAKVFNFEKPRIKSAGLNTYYGGASAGIDLNEFINIFRFRRNKRMLKLQKWMLQREQEKYVDYRFSKALVRRLTSLTGVELDRFMEAFRPGYEELQHWGEVELGMYILGSLKIFRENPGAYGVPVPATDSLPRKN